MKQIFPTRVLRILLILLFLVSLFIFAYVLPLAAAEQRGYYPELAHIEQPMLFVTRLLTILFMAGLGIIIRMTRLFDKSLVYTQPFLRLLRILTGLGFAAAAGVTGVFFFLSQYGGPGPALGLLMIGGTLCILIVSVVFLLIHRIIRDAMEYKEIFDTTV